ncbi:UpxY family transcription antiterminator [Mangrovibacterium lignilyticum]|uniref:UpxY family transcription antiterminator n=1 Tax=Mangrovibacterium lignilyticum TaxID=2668052 RepID=UPI0013D05A80|nr:UpxY family transcription antiterminator [Mangrovibacterium lignilyticum]
MNETKPEQKQWFAIYVKSRSEKKTWQRLNDKGIACYLPLQKKLRQWSDRKKLVELPFIPGYLFVNISRREYDLTLQTENVSCFVTSNGKAVPIREKEITAMQQALSQQEISVDLCPRLLKPGQKVEVISGPLVGLQATFVQLKGKKTVGIRIEQLQSTITLSVPLDQLAIRGNS